MVITPPIGPDGHPVDIVGVDSSIIQHPTTWKASGHVGGFNDPMVDCRETKNRYRADHLWVFRGTFPKANEAGVHQQFAIAEPGASESDAKPAFEKRMTKLMKRFGAPTGYEVANYTKLAPAEQAAVWGPDATQAGTLTEPRMFNLMFETQVGAVRTEESKAYLRPETAQGIFLNFKNVIDTTRVKVPFGVAQI